MLPLWIGQFIAIHALQWDRTIDWSDVDEWPFPWKILKYFWNQGIQGFVYLLTLPVFAPLGMTHLTIWLSLPYLLTLAIYFTVNLKGSPPYVGAVPSVAMMHAWCVFINDDTSHKPLAWIVMTALTIVGALATAYITWWRPRQAHRRIDRQRDLREEQSRLNELNESTAAEKADSPTADQE